MLKWTLITAAVYIASAIALVFAAGDFTLIAIPFALVYAAFARVRQPPSWRLERAVRSLRRDFTGRVPAIIELRTAEWARGTPTVYLVCAADADVPTLRAQLEELRNAIEHAAMQRNVPDAYLARMRIWPASRPAIDREGGWFGFDHNVPFPEPG
jgi:hypothetical protein